MNINNMQMKIQSSYLGFTKRRKGQRNKSNFFLKYLVHGWDQNTPTVSITEL